MRTSQGSPSCLGGDPGRLAYPHSPPVPSVKWTLPSWSATVEKTLGQGSSDERRKVGDASPTRRRPKHTDTEGEGRPWHGAHHVLEPSGRPICNVPPGHGREGSLRSSRAQAQQAMRHGTEERQKKSGSLHKDQTSAIFQHLLWVSRGHAP